MVVPRGSGGSRRLDQAGAIVPLKRGANSAKWLNLSGGGMKIGL
jgi:hypothetical protein